MARTETAVALLLMCACDRPDAIAPVDAAPADAPPPRSPCSGWPVTPYTLDDAGTNALDDAASSVHAGRVPRRMDIDQLRTALEERVGARWTGPRTVWTPEVPSGRRFEAEADLFEFFAAAMGRPDYVVSTVEVMEPTITFVKLATDAARGTCAAGVRADVSRVPAERLLLVEVTPTDTLPADEAAVRRNIAAMALRLWSFELAPESETASAVLGVFRVAVGVPGATPLDGWRAVCIDMTTDPRFLSY